MFEGYVCERDRNNLKNERVINVVEVGKGQSDPISDAPETCIYCQKETHDLFVLLEDF